MSNMKLKIQLGDLVTIKNFCKDLNGKTGTVTNIDGAYVLVRVFEGTRKEREIELLDVEVIKDEPS